MFRYRAMLCLATAAWFPASGGAALPLQITAAQQAPPVERLVGVGDAVAATARLALFAADPGDPDRDVSAVDHVTGDGSLLVLDHAGTALVGLPARADTGQIFLDTTRPDVPGGVGLARLLRVNTSRAGVCVVLALRADNSRGIFRMDSNRHLTLLGVLPDATSRAELAISDGDQIAFVAPDRSVPSRPLTLFQAVGGQPPQPLAGVGDLTSSGLTVVGFHDLQSNSSGVLTYILDLRVANGAPVQAVVRGSSAGQVGVVVTGRASPGLPGPLTEVRQPRIGPDGTVVFLGIGAPPRSGGPGFVNFFADGPGRPLQPLLPGNNWNPGEGASDYDIGAGGVVAIRAAVAPSTDSTLYLVTPTGGASVVVTGRRDTQPIGRPVFMPGATDRFFFLARNLDLPPDRNGHFPVGLFRARPAQGGLVVEAVAVPGQPMPDPKTPGRVLTLTQRPVVSADRVVFGVIYGGDRSAAIPTAELLRSLPLPAGTLFQVPLIGILADGSAVAPEGFALAGGGRLAMIRDLSFRGDGTVDSDGLLPGAGPVIVPSSSRAGIARVARTQAEIGIEPLVAAGSNLGLGADTSLEYVLPPLLPLGTSQELLVGRFRQKGQGGEGLFLAGPVNQQVGPLRTPQAVAPGPTPAGGAPAAGITFDRFSTGRMNPVRSLNIEGPPSVLSESGSVNVVFKALLDQGTTPLSGVFQWNGSTVTTLQRSDNPATPVLEHWAAGRGGLAYLQARDAGGKAHLFRSRVSGAPLELLGAADQLANLENFVLSGDNLIILGTDRSGLKGLFSLDPAQGSLAPLRTASGGLVLQGQPVPAPAAQPVAGGFTFDGQFTFETSSARGVLLFRATLKEPGGESLNRRGLFLLTGGTVQPLLVESVSVSGARDLGVGTLSTVDSQSASGTTIYADLRDGLWAIWRSRVVTDSRGSVSFPAPEALAQEVGPQGERRRDVPASAPSFTALDPSAMLGLAPLSGPVFAISDAGQVVFMGVDLDKKGWGVFRARP